MSIRWVSFRNDSGEEIPAFGVVRITGVVTVGSRPYLKAEKPNADSPSDAVHFVNGAVAVASTRFGKCTLPSNGPTWAKYATADGTPALFEQWGAEDGSWELNKDVAGFRVVGGATDGRVLVVSDGASTIREGILDGDLAASTDSGGTETTATLSVWTGSGANWADSGNDITVTNRNDSFSASTGDHLLVTTINGEWRPLAGGGGGGECPDRNEIHFITIAGATGGTFDYSLTVNNATETLTFNYNDAASSVETEFETHSEIASGDVEVTGASFPGGTMRVEFKGLLAGTAIVPGVPNHTSLTGTGVSVIVIRQQVGHPN